MIVTGTVTFPSLAVTVTVVVKLTELVLIGTVVVVLPAGTETDALKLTALLLLEVSVMG